MLDEGGRTIGVWLPLAMADIISVLVVLVRMWAKNGEEIQVPSRSETLATWCLPMLSSSLKASEEEAAALELLESVKRLKARQEAKKQ